MKNHLIQHSNDIRDLKVQYDDTKNNMQSNIRIIFTKTLNRLMKVLYGQKIRII